MAAYSIEEVEEAGGYSILLADPPWCYKNAGRGAASGHYLTISDESIGRLPVDRIAAKDAVLFLWVTWPTLPVGLATMAAWGFDYKTLGFLWVKTNVKAGTPFWGGGFWTRANSEPCLLGVRGNIRRVSASVHQLVETWNDQDDIVLRAPVGKHSAKPPEVRNRILTLMGNLSAIELFAREKVEGWDAFGNEIESDIVLGGETAS